VADPRLGVNMPAPQRELYDQVLEAYQQSAGTKGAALEAIQGLRQASLHPIARNPMLTADSADAGLALSARLLAAVSVLDEVRARGEKAIVFVINKRLQQLLALWLQE